MADSSSNRRNSNSSAATSLPNSILIVGGGAFGLSTALALTRRHTGKITLIDSSPTIPNPHGSSVDSSRIIRADYANDAYSRLADDALRQWRTTEWGQEGRYTQNGLVLVCGEKEQGAGIYVRDSLKNVKALNENAVVELPSREDVQRVVPGYGIGAHVAGGYVNWDSGWGNAEKGVEYAKKLLDETGRVEFRTGVEVKRLLVENNNGSCCGKQKQQKVKGVELMDSSTIEADLVVLATGAWTGKLVDLRGRAEATGQVLSYIRITDEEQARLANMPTLLNFSTGMFIIPPRDNLLKVARHAYGYRNPKLVPDPNSASGGGTIEVSLPEYESPVPVDGTNACRDELNFVIPAFADRPFVKTRICWYTDTPKGDFIISHHPSYDGLFLATGGSGHGYKFLPVIGDRILDAIEGKLDPDLQKLWAWPEKPLLGSDQRPAVVWTEDGSRSGAKGLILADELAKEKRVKSRL